MTPEAKVKAEIKAYLSRIGAYYIMPVATGYGAPMLDIFAAINGRFVAIEVKSATGEPTARQLTTIERIKRAGAVAFVARSVHEVARELQIQGIL